MLTMNRNRHHPSHLPPGEVTRREISGKQSLYQGALYRQARTFLLPPGEGARRADEGEPQQVSFFAVIKQPKRPHPSPLPPGEGIRREISGKLSLYQDAQYWQARTFLLPPGEGARRADEGGSNRESSFELVKQPNPPHPSPLPPGEGICREISGRQSPHYGTLYQRGRTFLLPAGEGARRADEGRRTT